MRTTRLYPPLLASALLIAATAAFAQDAGPEIPPGTDLHPPPSYWQSLDWGGPIFQALHLLLLATFIGSLVVLFRRTTPGLSLALALGPFIFGAFATWLSAYGLAVATRSWMYEGDVYSSVAAVPRPFHLGFALSAVALLLRFFRHAFSRS